jgi:hypothetical protein
MFISLLAQRNEPKKKQDHLVSQWLTALRSAKLPGVWELASLRHAKLLFGSFFDARLREMAITKIIIGSLGRY